MNKIFKTKYDNCEYDDQDWELVDNSWGHNEKRLHYKHKDVIGTVYVPVGLVDPIFLFYECNIMDGCSIVFQTAVDSIAYMFSKCKFGNDVRIIGLKSLHSTGVDANALFLGCNFSSEVYLDSMLKVSCGRTELMFACSNYEVAFKSCIFELCDDGYELPLNRFFVETMLDENYFRCCKVNYIGKPYIKLYGSFADSVITGSDFSLSWLEGLDTVLYMAFRNAKFSVDRFTLSVETEYLDDGALSYTFENAELPMILSLDVPPQKWDVSREEWEEASKYNDFPFDGHPTYYYMFNHSSPKYLHFSERMFNGPEQAYLGMFGNCNLPSYITATEPQEIMRQFNEAYEWYENQPDDILEQCKRELIKLLSSGKSLTDASKELQDKYMYVNIEEISGEISAAFTEKCSKDVFKLLEIPSGSSYCRYTIGDVVEKLVKAGYPRDVVNECVIGYIRDQYIAV